MEPAFHTATLRLLIDRYQGGDRAALDELVRRAGARLEQLARCMLRDFPRVRRQEETADAVREAVVGLMSALRELKLGSVGEFYGLAAEYMRRRLLDMARRCRRPVNNLASLEQVAPANSLPSTKEEDLERWEALHEAVERLPAELREVFGLRFYHDWSRQEVADLLQVSTRTVDRLWLAAQEQLAEALGR